MPRLAMRTPHHGRQDLPRVADRLEGGVESIAEAEQGVYGHRRIPCRRRFMEIRLPVDLIFHAETLAFDDDGLGVMQQPVQDRRRQGTVIVKYQTKSFSA